MKPKNIFVNSQIRGIAGSGYLSTAQIITLADAIGTLLNEQFDEPCNILIATDTRTSSPSIKQALLQGLSFHEHNVYDAGICPTPFVAKALKEYDPSEQEDQEDKFDEPSESGFFTIGIMITASHNPAEYNGIKILTEFGYMTKDIEDELSTIFTEFLAEHEYDDDTIEPAMTIDIDVIRFYQSKIQQLLQHESFTNLSVVLDCAHGATALIAPAIFKSYNITTTAINNTQDGTLINKNSGCGNPEILIKAIKDSKSTWGCAFDGDGDRVIIAHESGKIYDGDDLLAILSLHPDYQEYNTLVGTIMTNQGIVAFAQAHNKRVIRTQVGERNVINALIEHKAMIGSEPCGHITIMDHAFCSDGIFAALLFFDTITAYPNLLDTPYIKVPQVHTTVQLKNKTLDSKTINSIISEYQQSGARIVVRPSNTEPVLRIMVEHSNQQEAENITKQLQQNFLNYIG